jgi:hypothetical protein
MEIKPTEPKASITALSETEQNKAQPAERHPWDDKTLNQGKECPPQAAPAALKPWQATVHKSGTLNFDSALEPHSVAGGHEQETTPGDRQRERSRDIAQGTKIPRDGPAEGLPNACEL